MENASVSITAPSAQWPVEELVIRPITSADVQNVRALHVCPSPTRTRIIQLTSSSPPGRAGTFFPRTTPNIFPPTPHPPNAPWPDRHPTLLRQAHRLHRRCPPRPHLRPDIAHYPALL